MGTSSLLERRGACVALVTTEGFEDVFEIGRQARPRLYDLEGTRCVLWRPRSRGKSPQPLLIRWSNKNLPLRSYF